MHRIRSWPSTWSRKPRNVKKARPTSTKTLVVFTDCKSPTSTDDFFCITSGWLLLPCTDHANSRLSAIAAKLEIDTSTISAAAPSSSTKTAAAKVDADRDLVNNLDKQFIQRIAMVSADYAGRKFQDLMKQKNTANVTKDNLVEKWTQYIRQKALRSELELFDNLSPNQLTLLYFRMSKELADQAKASQGLGGSESQQLASPSNSKKRKMIARKRPTVVNDDDDDDDDDDDTGNAGYGDNLHAQASPFGGDATFDMPFRRSRPREETPSHSTPPAITLSQSRGFDRTSRPRSVLFSDRARTASSALLAEEAAADAMYRRQVSSALGLAPGVEAINTAIPTGYEHHRASEDERMSAKEEEEEEAEEDEEVFGIPKKPAGSDQGSARTMLRRKDLHAPH